MRNNPRFEQRFEYVRHYQIGNKIWEVLQQTTESIIEIRRGIENAKDAF